MFGIRFARTKASADRSIELDLHQKLGEINSRIDGTPENSSLVNEARKLKIELEEIAVRKTRGAIIYLFIYLFVCLFVCLFIYLFIYLFYLLTTTYNHRKLQ